MKAMLLAAGLGTRLRPLTDTVPKCLVPIQGRPLMDYWLDMLWKSGVSPVLVNLHYLGDQVADYISRSPYKDAVETVWENRLLGTGGTLLKNRRFFKEEPVLVIHGDNLSVFDVQGFMDAHNRRPQGCCITMMTFETDAPETCGIVELDENGVVSAFHEKQKHPPGNLANGAVYIIEPAVFDFMESLGQAVVDFSTQVLPCFMGRIFTFHNSIYHRDIGTPESYKQANRDIISLPALT